MFDNKHEMWQEAAMEFEKKMLDAMSFGDSTGAEECMVAHDESWGLEMLDGHHPYRKYPTKAQTLSYAKYALQVSKAFVEHLEAGADGDE